MCSVVIDVNIEFSKSKSIKIGFRNPNPNQKVTKKLLKLNFENNTTDVYADYFFESRSILNYIESKHLNPD